MVRRRYSQSTLRRHSALDDNGSHSSDRVVPGNALQAASAAGHVHIINLLLENKPPALVSTPGGWYGSALMAAVVSGSSDTAFALLEEKANPNLRSKAHGRPLEKAADMGWTGREIVKDLLEYKGEIDVSQKVKGLHILHKAARYDMQELAIHCLEKGCSIDITTSEGPAYYHRFGDFARVMTPLAYACAEGHAGMVRLLLRRGASLESDRDPSAVLWIAAYQGHPDVVDTLITTFKAGHDKNQVASFFEQRPFPQSGHPILFAAATSTSPDTVRRLVEHGVKYQSNWFNATPLLGTATFRRPNVTKCLLDLHEEGKIDVCIDQKANHGRTALFEACELNRQRITDHLLNAGADYTISDIHDNTPLHASAHHDNIGVMTLLLKKALKDNGRTPAFYRFLNAKTKTGQTALIHCTERNRLTYFNLLLDYGADYTISGHTGNTSLHWAGRMGNDTMIVTLLEKAKGAERERKSFKEFLNSRNREGRTALAVPVMSNRISTVKLLLDYGIDYCIGRNNDVTPLHSACYRGFTELVQLLLDTASQDLDAARFAAFLNQQNSKGKTALMDAVDSENNRSPHMSIVRILLDHGADPLLARAENITPLHHACWIGHHELVTLLLKRAPASMDQASSRTLLNQRNHKGATPFMDAINSMDGETHFDVVQTLLDHGADYMMPKNRDITVLHHCCYCGKRDLLKLLLACVSEEPDPIRRKAFINQQTEKGKTALFDAADTNRLEIVDMMLSHDADYSIPQREDITVLHVACHRGYREVVERILAYASKGVDTARFQSFLNHRNDKAKTALIDAVETARPVICEMLLNHGANYTMVKRDNITVLHIASHRGHFEVTKRLLAHGKRDADTSRFIAFLNHRNKWGRTALVDAAATDRPNIMKMLLEDGADYTISDERGFTALHHCASRGHSSCVRGLLEHLARRSRENNAQHTCVKDFVNQRSKITRFSALHDAAKQGRVTATKILLEHGVEYDTYDWQKFTPLHHAVDKGNEDLAMVLLKHAKGDRDRAKFKRFLEARKERGGETEGEGAKRMGIERVVALIEECEREFGG